MLPVQGAVQQQQQGDPGGRRQDWAHPKTELTEVTVLDDGEDGGTAQEHGHLAERDKQLTYTKDDIYEKPKVEPADETQTDDECIYEHCVVVLLCV